MKKTIQEMYRLLDWLMALPDKEEVEFYRKLVEYEEKNVMAYITSIERIGREAGLKEGLKQGVLQGMQQGMQQGKLDALQESVLDLLEIRFNDLSYGLREKIKAVHDIKVLKRLNRHAATCRSLAQFEKQLGQ